MRPCPEFYGNDARRTPAAAPQLLTRLCRTRVDQRARAVRASRTRLPRRNARGSVARHRALLLGATSASGAHAACGRRGGTPCPARKARATDRGTPLHLVVRRGRRPASDRDDRAQSRSARSAGSLIEQRTAADVDNRCRHAEGPVGGGEGGRVADVLERCVPPEQGLPLDQLDDLLATLDALWGRLGHPSARERDDAYSVRAQLDGELPPDRLDRVEGDLRPAQVVVAQRAAAVAG